MTTAAASHSIRLSARGELHNQLQVLSAQDAILSVALFHILALNGKVEQAAAQLRRTWGEKFLISSMQGVLEMQQYYTVQVATGETALPDFNYLIQYQNNYHAAVMLGIGIIIGCLLAMAFLRR